ncbi:MAG: hypothetical protein R3249_10260 [Nitriliruptorales bacterium]|nr:hypothetical protein [Nitriliruptorales bacterium]
MLDILREIQAWLGGGTLTVWTIVGAGLFTYIAFKAAKFAMRIAAIIVALALLISIAPWSTEGEDSERADCIVDLVTTNLTTLESIATKRMTLDEADALTTCIWGQGVRGGAAQVRLRTFYDIPFQTITVTEDGISRSIEFGDI